MSERHTVIWCSEEQEVVVQQLDQRLSYLEQDSSGHPLTGNSTLFSRTLMVLSLTIGTAALLLFTLFPNAKVTEVMVCVAIGLCLFFGLILAISKD